MTPLGQIIARRIAASGPITLADYMAECLLHPEHGYYTTREPFGRQGDFITAPEVSQMFGELIGLALAQAWLDQGAPSRAALVELGPGRGTLMADALRATGAVPGFHEAMEVWLVEASPRLRTQQATAVPGARFADHLGDFPPGPLFLIANEFLDALPIRQFQRAETGWQERVVGLSGGKLALGLAPALPREDLAGREDVAPGQIVELCPALPAIVGEAAGRIARHGGAALWIDYGDWQSLGDTFQALQDGKPADPFAAPGHADLTAHVDFAAVARAAAPAVASPMVQQGVFLERLGITPRAQALAGRLTGAALESHIAAHRRLTHPDEMGHLFKVMGLTPEGAAPVPGVAP